MATPSVLVIGGPPDEHVDRANVDRIGSDYLSVLNGAPRPYYDYDFVVYWPGEAGLALPRLQDQWRARRKERPYLPEIPAAFWKERREEQLPTQVPAIPDPRGAIYDPSGAMSGQNILALHRLLLRHFNAALRPIISAAEGGQICFCVVPAVMPTGLAGSAMDWLSPYLQWSQVRPEQAFFDPAAFPDNPVAGRLGAMTPLLKGIATFRITHNPLSFGNGHEDYGRFCWDELLFWGDHNDCRPDYEAWPQQQHIVDVLPGHTTRVGAPKSLLFMTGSAGGLAVMPEPCSMQAMVDRISGAHESQSEPNRESPLLKMVKGHVSIRFSRDSRIQSLEQLAAAIDTAKTQAEAMKSFGYTNPADFVRIIEGLKHKKKTTGAQDVLLPFIAAAKERFRSLPPR